MTIMTSENDEMKQSDYNSPEFAADQIVLHRPTVQKCLEKCKELKRKYVDLERKNITLQAKIKLQKVLNRRRRRKQVHQKNLNQKTKRIKWRMEEKRQVRLT